MSVGEHSLEEHLAAFERGAVDLIERDELARRLDAARASGRGLRVKFGMDPSSPDLHFGHAVPLRKLRDLQELGHTIVLIVGDATAMVGDPSGRNKLRPQLTRADVQRNLETYTRQAGLVLDLERTEIRKNSEWFDGFGFEDVLRLTARMTVAQMLQRDTFQKRVREEEPIGLHEFLYPLMQGWDSVMVEADVELGGTDQLFNLLVGRDLQQAEGQPPQLVVTTPLVNGLDGRKMSKSYSNAIQLTDEPGEVFGKAMSLSDEVMGEWFTLLTRLSTREVEALLAGHPRAAKVRLAVELCAFVHGRAAADEAQAAFDRQFRQGALPDDIPEHAWPAALGAEAPLSVLLREVFGVSGAEARRLIKQGAVKLERDGERVAEKDEHATVARPAEPFVIQVGKRRFARLR